MPAKSVQQPRLGRGLSSLIKVPPHSIQIEIPPPTISGLATVLIEKVHPNPHQPRRQFNDVSLAELAASIKSSGLIQPIFVRPTPTGYELIAGERRLRAAQIAGLKEIAAIVREVDSPTQAQLALVENIQREDLNPLDRAAAYQSLIDQLGLTQNELANRLGEERSTIANFLRLLNLSEAVAVLIRNGKLSLGHAKLLAGVSMASEQLRLAELIIAQDLSVRNVEQLLRNGSNALPTSPRPNASATHLQDIEKSISQQLGMRVQLRASSKGSGRLVIYYGNLDQFDELVRQLQVKIPE